MKERVCNNYTGTTGVNSNLSGQIRTFGQPSHYIIEYISVEEESNMRQRKREQK